MVEGIQWGLQYKVEKYSEVLRRNAIFIKSSKLLSLPSYLVIQKMRFVWREKAVSANTEAGKVKILRNVAYPKILDMFDFCCDELKSKLAPNRIQLADREEF